MSWVAERIEHWPLSRLLPYAKNARTHSDEQIAQIAASIVEFGFTNPILVGSDGIEIFFQVHRRSRAGFLACSSATRSWFNQRSLCAITGVPI